ncbi:10513_t:CDS:2 [Acaulospora colombiana]|uniref:10513_t:CDS:1 n=1 Tax=Acaulospora colombiana TaxID=27376 RepID=A0ACA9MAR9_9GLOM|nr:10513_t:CDS:2 [Acaulospora colombiana]
MCLKDDGLDPSHYVSAPGMFNNSLYKSSGAELKLMTDIDEYLIVENGIRGGMTMTSHRYAKAPQFQTMSPASQIPGSCISALARLLCKLSISARKADSSRRWLSLYNERLVRDKNVGALQTYIKFGIKVTKIYSALKFKQSPLMKEYSIIEENICKRKIAKANVDEFGVMYYKLKYNAVFSKQMENV